MFRKRMTLTAKRTLYGYLFISPWVIGFLLFFVTPIIRSIRFSFSRLVMRPTGYNLEWVGFSNFINAFTIDANYPRLLVESIGNVLIDVPVILVFSFFVALLLKQKSKGNSFAKTIFFLPVIMSSGVFMMLQSEFSSINAASVDALMEEGARSINMLQSINISQYMLEAGATPRMVELLTGPIDRIYDVITESGIQIFIYLAGLHSISPQLYEACHVEGATGWETFWKITFPMLSPLILVNMVYTIIDKFTSFKTASINYIYDMAFYRLNFGLSSAMAWIFFLVLSVILIITVGLISKKIFYHT